MDIKGIIKDILSDISVAQEKYDKFSEETYTRTYSGGFFGSRRRKNCTAGFFRVYFPNILGILLGAAVSKLLGVSSMGITVMLCTAFAVAAGTFNDVNRNDMSIVPAVIRNVIMMAAAAMILFVLYWITAVLEN